VIDIEGRCIFDTLENLRQNPPTLAFARNRGRDLLREAYSAADVSRLCDAERSVSKAERLVYGFQIGWVARIRGDSG
jgi:hypothetical protein